MYERYHFFGPPCIVTPFWRTVPNGSGCFASPYTFEPQLTARTCCCSDLLLEAPMTRINGWLIPFIHGSTENVRTHCIIFTKTRWSITTENRNFPRNSRKRGEAQRVARPACANATLHFLLTYRLTMLLIANNQPLQSVFSQRGLTVYANEPRDRRG